MTQENSSKPSSASVEYRCYHCKQVFPDGTDHFGKYEEMPKCIENPRRGVYGGIHDAYIRVRKDFFSQMEAQLAAQPSVQRDEDGIGWCSSCDKIHEVVRPKCPSCGDWLIFAADDKPEDSAQSFNDGVKAATDYLRGMHNMETLAFLTEKTVLRITAERGSK